MAEYKSKPHIIEAFQFNKDEKIIPPKWFRDAYEKGQVQITMSERDGYYIVVYGEGQMEKAQLGHWICHHNGKIYVLNDKKFRESYEV